MERSASVTASTQKLASTQKPLQCFISRESGGQTAALHKTMNPKHKPNGHGALLARSSGANGNTISSSGMGRAASDDASELSVANAAASSAVAGAEREACADLAPAQGEGKRHRSEGAASKSHPKSGAVEKEKNKNKARTNDKEASEAIARRDVSPGLEPLPIDGEAFVDAVHTQVDLVQLEVDLLSSKDDKIVQRELAYLRELRYGKRAAPAEDEPQIILNMQQPERELS